jgi:hypothetical protein
LCGVLLYASAQSLDFLAMTKNSSFPNWKRLVLHPVFPDENELGSVQGTVSSQGTATSISSGSSLEKSAKELPTIDEFIARKPIY